MGIWYARQAGSVNGSPFSPLFWKSAVGVNLPRPFRSRPRLRIAYATRKQYNGVALPSARPQETAHAVLDGQS